VMENKVLFVVSAAEYILLMSPLCNGISGLQDAGFLMDLSTTFEDFASVVTTDKRSQALDAGNIKLTYKTVWYLKRS